MSETPLPTKQELHAAIAKLVALRGSEYTGWRQRLRHAIGRRKWSEHGFVHNAAEFQPFLALYSILESRHGSDVAVEKLDAVLLGVTAERRRHYDTQYRSRERTAEEVDYIKKRNRKYMRDYRSRSREDNPSHEDNPI